MPSKIESKATDIDRVTQSLGTLALKGRTASRVSSDAGDSVETQRLSTASVTNSILSSTDGASPDQTKGKRVGIASRYQRIPDLSKFYGTGNFNVANWLDTVAERLRFAGIERTWWAIAASSALRAQAWTWYQLARGRYQARHGKEALMDWQTFCKGLTEQFGERPVATSYERLLKLACDGNNVRRYVEQFCQIVLRVPAGSYTDQDLKLVMFNRLPPKIAVAAHAKARDDSVDFEHFIATVRKINAAIM